MHAIVIVFLFAVQFKNQAHTLSNLILSHINSTAAALGANREKPDHGDGLPFQLPTPGGRGFQVNHIPKGNLVVYDMHDNPDTNMRFRPEKLGEALKSGRKKKLRVNWRISDIDIEGDDQNQICSYGRVRTLPPQWKLVL